MLRCTARAPDLGDIGVQRGHPFKGGTGHAVPLKIAKVSNLVDEDVGTLREGDQIVVHGGVAREHHGAVRGVERYASAGTARPFVTATTATRTTPIVEDDDRNLGNALRPRRGGDIDAPDEFARVRHTGVQRHDVQMVGVVGEDALDQVRRAGAGRSGRIIVV